ncbi:MAG: IclR family transcriptional regulator [Rhodobacteraceae bacterium HLUCCA12]|nr:MAG: IclR family transcriptional regulator [Rhodobacteraceae bacterium HLUCCA12]
MVSRVPNNRKAESVDERLFIRSVARALRALEAMGRAARPMSLSELAQAIEVDKSAAQRITQTLLGLGYLERDPRDGTIVLGKKLLDRSFDYLRSNPLIERASPILLSLRETTRERVDFSLFDGHSIIYALRMQSKRETFFATVAGRRIPTFSSAGGRACLALLDPDEAEHIIKSSDRPSHTPRTITDPAVIMDRVAEAREQGYACALEESLIGEIVVAAAVRDGDRPVGAIHIAGSLSEWDEGTFRRRFAPLAVEGARALSS